MTAAEGAHFVDATPLRNVWRGGFVVEMAMPLRQAVTW